MRLAALLPLSHRLLLGRSLAQSAHHRHLSLPPPVAAAPAPLAGAHGGAMSRSEHTQAAAGAAAAASVGLLASLWDRISQAFANNQFASGGLTLMATGFALAAMRKTVELAVEQSKRRLLVRAEVDSRDDAYRWIMHWLAQHEQFHASRHVSITTSLGSFGVSGLEGGLAGSKKVFYLPAPGDHILRFQGQWVWISRKRQSGNPQMSANARLLVETLQLTALGRSRDVLEALVAAARAAYEASSKQRTSVFSVGPDGYWQQVGCRPVRPLRSVILPGRQANELLADCREFLASEEWYAHHGIPYRRGYLLYGQPGTGKTSLVSALAGDLQLDVYVVTLSSPAMTDEVLRNLLNTAGDRCVLLLEDVDAAFVGRGAGEGSARTGCSLTFSGLLNAIDGVAAQEGRLLFMTTNHIERLSSALIRPGRVDVRLEFKLACREQMRQLFVSFYADLPPAQAHLPPAEEVLSEAGEDEGQAHMAGEAAAPAPPAEAAGSRAAAPADASVSPPGGTPDARDDAVAAAGHEQQEEAAPQVSGPGAAGAQLSVAELEQLADEFAEALPEHSASMAALQGHLMMHKRDPWAAVATAATRLVPTLGVSRISTLTRTGS